MSSHLVLGHAAQLQELRGAAASHDGARRVRLSPEAACSAWRALAEGRWPIIESLDRAGRRLLVARPVTPLCSEAPPGPQAAPAGHSRHLSPQETRVVFALAKGHANKLIAHELGLATSTVSTLLARAGRKLGCRNRIELAHAGRALTRRLTDRDDAQEPA